MAYLTGVGHFKAGIKPRRLYGVKCPIKFNMKIAILIILFMFPNVAHAFDRYNNVVKFDRYFSKYSKRYFGPNFNWHYFKAQAVAESRLKADARSRVGAVGLMQIMPKTFKEIVQKEPTIKGTRKQPRWNIAAGIYYDRQIWKLWQAERSFQDRINFMFASYNAGKGNILKAQKIAAREKLNPNLWESIEPALQKVTGKHSQETITYVKKINHIKEVLR
jgi:soluble lytic murein transglycosylase-like protein